MQISPAKAAEVAAYDETVGKPQSYKDIYESQRGGAVYCFMAIIGSMRLARAFANVGKSFAETAGAIARFGRAVKGTYRAEDN